MTVPISTSSRLFERQREAKADADAKAFVKRSVTSILESSVFDSANTQALSYRKNYAFAVAALAREAAATDATIEALILPPVTDLAPFRFACLFSVIPPDRDEMIPFRLADLRSMKSEAALCALAALGEIDWPTAPKRCRAIFALRALIAESRS